MFLLTSSLLPAMTDRLSRFVKMRLGNVDLTPPNSRSSQRSVFVFRSQDGRTRRRFQAAGSIALTVIKAKKQAVIEAGDVPAGPHSNRRVRTAKQSPQTALCGARILSAPRQGSDSFCLGEYLTHEPFLSALEDL